MRRDDAPQRMQAICLWVPPTRATLSASPQRLSIAAGSSETLYRPAKRSRGLRSWALAWPALLASVSLDASCRAEPGIETRSARGT